MIRKIFLIFIGLIVLLTESVSGFYNYENRFKIFSLNRNISKTNCVVSYDKTTLTKDNVEVKFEFDKIVDIIRNSENTIVSEDGKTITKILKQNEDSKITVRDEDFNYQDIEYKVDWIDNEPPKISGAENGKIYNTNVHLNYTDNYTVKDIYSNYYSDSFSIYADTEDFYETDTVQIVPATKTTITAYVTSNTREMEKYRYYLNGDLYKTTSDKKYTFRGLQESTNYLIRVEALDRYGNIIDVKETTRKTIPISNVEFSYSWENKYVAIKGVPSSTTKVEVYAWVRGHFDDTYQKVYVLNDSVGSYVTTIGMSNFKNYTGRYVVLFNVFYKESNGSTTKMDVLGTFEMPNKYNSSYYNGLPNDFVYNGNYYVRCIDEVGNESELDFTIQK